MKGADYLSAARKYILPVCGYLYLWIVVVNVVGVLLITVNRVQSCILFGQMFGLLGIEIRCPNEMISTLFAVIVEIPRILIMPACLAATMIKLGILRGEYSNSILAALRWMVVSIPLFLIAVPGFYYWRRKSTWLAISMSLLLAILIIYAGIRM